MNAKPQALTHLLEEFRSFGRGTSGFRVDRATRTIYGVKVLGLISKNDRKYSPAAVQRAAPLYEGRKVYANHDTTRRKSRKVEDLIGTIRNVRWDGSGLRADLTLNHAHPMFERVMSDAEAGDKGMYGLSHNAEGEVENGVVTAITEVHSVDLVDDPATTTNLQESRCDTKLKEEDMDPDQMGGADSPPVDDTPAPAPMPADTGTPSAKASLSAAVSAIFEDETLSLDDVKKAILALIKVADDLKNSGDSSGDSPLPEEEGSNPYDDSSDDDSDGDSASDDTDDDSEDDMKESRKQKPPHAGVVALTERVNSLQRELAVRDLVESAGLTFRDKPARALFLRVLAPLSDADRKALIEERKALAESAKKSPVRSQPAGCIDNDKAVAAIFERFTRSN